MWRLGFWLLVAGLVLAPSPALAQEATAAEKDSARKAMIRGDALMTRGEAAEALKMFQAADAIMNVPSTGLAVARALKKLGRLVESRQAAERAANLPVTPREPKAFAAARKEAAGLVSELDRAIPTIEIRVEGRVPASELELRIDANELPAGAAGKAHKVDPGEHTIRAHASGWRDATEHVTVREGEKASVTLHMKPVAAASDSAKKAPMRSGDAAPARSGSGSSLVIVGFGLAGAGVIAGSVTGLMSMSKISSVKEHCTGNVCPDSQQGEADTAKTLGWVSTIAFGVGVAGAALGVYGLTRGKASKPPARREQAGVRVTPALGPTTGILVQGQF